MFISYLCFAFFWHECKVMVAAVGRITNQGWITASYKVVKDEYIHSRKPRRGERRHSEGFMLSSINTRRRRGTVDTAAAGALGGGGTHAVSRRAMSNINIVFILTDNPCKLRVVRCIYIQHRWDSCSSHILQHLTFVRGDDSAVVIGRRSLCVSTPPRNRNLHI